MKPCPCADPESCTQAVPGYRCRKGEIRCHDKLQNTPSFVELRAAFEDLIEETDVGRLSMGALAAYSRRVDRVRLAIEQFAAEPAVGAVSSATREPVAWLVESGEFKSVLWPHERAAVDAYTKSGAHLVTPLYADG